MTPEEIEAFRGWCRTFEVPADSMIMKALTHIDQQATALDEAEALTKKNADQINALLAQVAALREIAIGERAGFLHYRASCYDPARRCPYAKGCDDCTGWDTCSALDRFNADAIRQLSEKHPEAFR